MLENIRIFGFSLLVKDISGALEHRQLVLLSNLEIALRGNNQACTELVRFD